MPIGSTRRNTAIVEEAVEAAGAKDAWQKQRTEEGRVGGRYHARVDAALRDCRTNNQYFISACACGFPTSQPYH